MLKSPMATGMNAGGVASPTNSPNSTFSGSPSSSTSNASSSTSVESSTISKIPATSPSSPSPQKQKLNNFELKEHRNATSLSKIPQPIQRSPRKSVIASALDSRVKVPAAQIPEIQASAPSKTPQPKKYSKGEQLKLAFAKEKAEREAARSAAMQAPQSGLMSAEEMKAQIKKETAERIKKIREERELLREAERLKEQERPVEAAAPSIPSATVKTAEECRTRLDQMRLRLKQEEEDRQAQRAAREAESLARQKGAAELRLVAWSPIPARAIAVYPMTALNEHSSVHMPATAPNVVTFKLDREEECSNESPEPVSIILVDSAQAPHSVPCADKVKENMDATQAQQDSDTQAPMRAESERIGQKAKSTKRSLIPRPVIKEVTMPSKKYPDIKTGFESLGIHVPDPRNGTPDRCATSWGAYLTYHLDNEHYEETSSRSASIQRCLQYFEKINEWKDKKINFELDFEPGPFDHHRGFIHDHLSISNTEGPFPNHHRTMSFLHSRYEHDPQICWQCHRARFENLYIIWEDEHSHNEYDFQEEADDHKGDIDLYDDDGFLIEYDEDGFLIDGNVYEDTGLHIREKFYENEIYLELDGGLEEDQINEEKLYGDEQSIEERRFYGKEGYDREEPPCENKSHNGEERQALESELDEFEQNEVYDETIIDEEHILNERECIEAAEEATSLVEEEQMNLPLVLKASSIQVTVTKSHTTHTQKENITYLRHTTLRMLKKLSPPTIKAITKALVNNLQFIVLIDPQHTALHYPLQRYFFDLLIDLVRPNLCHGHPSNNRPTYRHEPTSPTPLITSPPNNILYGSTAGTPTTLSPNSQLPAAHTILTRTGKWNSTPHQQVRRLRLWVLDMPPCKQVVSFAMKVKNGIKSLFGFGEATSS